MHNLMARPYKVAGADTIANVVFIQCTDLLVPHLGPLYQATFSLRVYPSQWKDLKTIVLKKLAKPDYTLPNTYQPIALLSTIAKILSTCITEDPVHMEEVHKLLPDKHLWCRPGRTTTDSLHYVVKYVKDTWRRNEVVSTLFLDIKSAFPSMVLHQLIHNMRQQGVPPKYMDWIAQKEEVGQQLWFLTASLHNQSPCTKA